MKRWVIYPGNAVIERLTDERIEYGLRQGSRESKEKGQTFGIGFENLEYISPQQAQE